jgi:hypothetical protein
MSPHRLNRPRALPLVVLIAVLGPLAAGCGQQAASPTLGAHADPELEATFPRVLHGEAFEVHSYNDPDTLTIVGVNQAFLDAIDVPISDVSVALVEHDATTNGPVHITATAYRARGARAKDLVEYFLPIIEGQSEDLPFVRARVGDKTVWRAQGNPIAVAGNVLYVNDDTAYLIYGNRKGATNQLLAQLP